MLEVLVLAAINAVVFFGGYLIGRHRAKPWCVILDEGFFDVTKKEPSDDA